MSKGLTKEKVMIEYVSLHFWLINLGHSDKEATEIITQAIKMIKKTVTKWNKP